MPLDVNKLETSHSSMPDSICGNVELKFPGEMNSCQASLSRAAFGNIILYYPCCAILCWVVVKIMRGLTKWSISRSIFSLASRVPSGSSIHLFFLRAQEASQLAGTKVFHFLLLFLKNIFVNWTVSIGLSKTKLLTFLETCLLSLVKHIFHLFFEFKICQFTLASNQGQLSFGSFCFALFLTPPIPDLINYGTNFTIISKSSSTVVWQNTITSQKLRGRCDNLQNLACMSNQVAFIRQQFELGTNELKTYFK